MNRTLDRGSSEVFRNFLELGDRLPLIARQRSGGGLEAIVDVILDQGPLGLANRLFDGMELLSDVEAGPPPLDHLGDAAEMSFRALQALQNLRVTLMEIGVRHGHILSPWSG